MCPVLAATVRLPPLRYDTGYAALQFTLSQPSLISHLRPAFRFNMETVELSNFLMEAYALRRLKNISARPVKNKWIPAIWLSL